MIWSNRYHLKTSLSWECAGFEQPRPADLTLSCTNIFKDILITFSCVFLSFLKLFKDTISNLHKVVVLPKLLNVFCPAIPTFHILSHSLYNSLSFTYLYNFFPNCLRVSWSYCITLILNILVCIPQEEAHSSM